MNEAKHIQIRLKFLDKIKLLLGYRLFLYRKSNDRYLINIVRARK